MKNAELFWMNAADSSTFAAQNLKFVSLLLSIPLSSHHFPSAKSKTQKINGRPFILSYPALSLSIVARPQGVNNAAHSDRK